MERFQRAGLHALADHRAFQQVAAKARQQQRARDLADPVPGAPGTLQPAGDRAGGFDHDHQVHCAHVDAQLQRAGRDDAAQASGLQPALDLGAALVGDAAVVGGDQVLYHLGVLRLLFAPSLVDALDQALAQPAAVDEHDGGAVLQYRGQQARLQACGAVAATGGELSGALAIHRAEDGAGRDRICRLRAIDGWCCVLGGRFLGGEDFQIEAGRLGRVDHLHLAVAPEEAARDLHRVHGRGKPDALRVLAAALGQAFQRQGQVRAALVAGQRMYLVDDDRVDRLEVLGGLRA